MRFASFDHQGQVHAGVVTDAGVHAIPHMSVLDLVESGLSAALEAGAKAAATVEAIALDDVTLVPPLRPPTLRDHVTFEEHVVGVSRAVDGSTAGVVPAWYDAPTFYFTNPHTLIGDGAEVFFPAECREPDFELEVAAVLTGHGSSVTVDRARDHVFGYTIVNDWSARDLQRREMQVRLGPCKGKDFATSMGPWLVTADELEPYRDPDGFLDLWCLVEVNGDEVGRDLLSNMGWTFETLTAYASRDSRIGPGDVLASGTVGNGGCLAELWGRNGRQEPPALRPGDEVALTVQGIGTLRNRVWVAEAAPPLPPVRRRDADAARRVAHGQSAHSFP